MKKILAIASILITGLTSLMFPLVKPETSPAEQVSAVENDLNQKRDVTKGIIIHNDAGSISGSQYKYLESYSEMQLARGFAHYYVAKGDIYNFWDDAKVAWHSGNFSGNTEYIGIEVTNSYGAETKFLENEQESFKLTAKLLTKYGLRPNRDTIRLHKEFSATACPHRSWALHGQNINSVKDYFISQVNKYMPLYTPTYKYNVGEKVQLTEIAGLAIDNSTITSQDRQRTGTVVSRQIMQHQGDKKDYPSYTIKWSNGQVQSYVDFDVRAATVAMEAAVTPSIKYTAHVASYSWLQPVNDGVTAGTTGQSRRMEALKIVTQNFSANSGIVYQSHVADYGWLSPVVQNQVAGTTGQSRRMEAINIKLTGDIAKEYDIYYRAHIQNYGWIGWTKNGENAGSTGKWLRMEAIEIRLVKKGALNAPTTGKALIS